MTIFIESVPPTNPIFFFFKYPFFSFIFSPLCFWNRRSARLYKLRILSPRIVCRNQMVLALPDAFHNKALFQNPDAFRSRNFLFQSFFLSHSNFFKSDNAEFIRCRYIVFILITESTVKINRSQRSSSICVKHNQKCPESRP